MPLAAALGRKRKEEFCESEAILVNIASQKYIKRSYFKNTKQNKKPMKHTKIIPGVIL